MIINNKSKATIIISLIIFSLIIPILPLGSNNGSITDNFLFIKNVEQENYEFVAEGACYIIIEVEDIGVTHFYLDQEYREVSYGMNIFSEDFGNSGGHNIDINESNLQYFKSIIVEPLFLKEGEIQVDLDIKTEINFLAGGPISILLRTNFSYDSLYVGLNNSDGEYTMFKRTYATDDYPEIDPLFYSLFFEQGTYIRYDIFLEPGEHSLILGGMGTLEYIIMVNLDWDGDLLSDVEEIQKDDLYNFKLDPMVADIWGYYERSDEFILSSKLEGTNLLEGTFTFYLPENQNINLLSIMVNSGVFKNMTIDGNSTVFQNKIFNSCASCQPDSEIFGEIDPSWHQINYKYKADNTSKVDFLINKEKIKVIKISEFKDTDGDGIKDLVEFSNGLASTKTDTDEDGIPDNFDGSPLAKLELNPLQLNQIVVPTDPNKDTIINLQVKKPNIDYSTNGVPRSWRDSFNVSIFPVLRMFGNKKDYDNPDIDDDLTLFRTNYRWRGQGEAVNHHYGPNEFFNSMKVGDPLPKPSDPNSEVHFIFANPSEFSLGYSIQIPKGHGSKNDNFIDFRFDFIWLITKYESKTDEHSILHYYDFEENIILQSMVMREISNISYILANPDGLIENQVLWALLQNPKLGNPEEFGVSDDVVGSGTVNYFGLNTQLKLDRKNNPLEANETEVLYIAGSYQNLDILNKIQLKTIPNPDFAILHQGDFEAFFSSYSISNLYENQSYVVNDPDIQGENKLLYLKYYSNDTENVGTGQERLNIINFPIALDVNANSKVVTISQAQGSNLLFEEMPYSINKLSDKITLRHQTYIECAVQNPGVPIIYFQKEVDILKEFLEKPHTNTDLTQTELEQLSTFIAGFWHQIDSIEGNLTALYELASSIQLPNEQQRVDLERIEGILNEIDDFKQFSYSKLDDYEDFFSFSYELSQDLSIIETFFLSNTNFMPVLVVLSENLYAINDLYVSIIESQAGFLKKARLASKRWRNFGEKPVFLEARSEIFTMKQNNIKNIRRAGWVTAFLGIVILFLEVAAIKDLYDNKDNYDETEFGLRITSGILGIALATLITVQGITVVIKAASIAKGVASTSLQWIGGFAAVLAVVIWVIDLVLMFKTDSWDEWDKVYDFCLNTALLGAVLIGIVSSGPLVVLAVAVLTWVFIHDLLGGLIFNRPDIEIMDDTEFFFLLHVEENIRRHGGLEIGDTVSLSLVIKNTGKGWGRRNDKLWMRARFKTYGDGWQGTWTGFQGLWGSGKDSPGYFEGDLFDKEFHTTITGAGPDVKTKIEFHLDWQKVKFIFFIPKRTREVGIRKAGNDAITDTLGMPSLENYISDFYQSTSAYITYEGAMRLFNSAIEQYSYRDAYAFAAEFASIFPVFEELKDLPIKSNLKLNLPEDLIEMDGRTGIADVNLKLSLEGPSSDKQKNMMFKLIPYEGFSISDNIINAPLSSTLDFTLFREDPHLRVGVYLFGIEVYHGITSELIFNASIPFLLNGYSCVELVDQFSAEPIIPGDFFCVLDVNNLGTYAETINTTIDGIPNDFIYKDLHPDDFFDINKQFFELFPGDSYEGLLIKPPRHYTTKPGIYTYNFRARDHMFDSFDINCTSTFEVAEFYDMDFQLISTTPGNTIFDYQSAVYTFNLTNLGNVNQTFNISYDDISFADEFYYSYDEYPLGDEESIPIELEPGESEFVDLVLIPTGWGEQSFNINATSFNNISTIPLNIEIIDDDINHPLLTDLKIIESPINITIEFNVLNEIDGDDRGLFCIELFIDNELIIYENPDSTEISFSLVINDTHGKWFIENGNHNIRIEITDADNDVPNDSLKSSYTSSFETTLEDMHKYVLWKIENLKQKINESSDDYWRNPASNLKNTMESKIDLSYTFLIFNEYDGAYSKFLHDIKPKLTGLKTDENEIEWGNGIFENPWINDESFQEELCLDCNEIMSYIKILASFV